MKRQFKINWIILVPVLIFLVLAVTCVTSVFLYQKYVVSPEREMVIKRYDEFRAVLATGNQERIMEFIAPKTRSWAKLRLHGYKLLAVPLDKRSTISVRSEQATICPRPQRHFYIIPGGNIIAMVKIDGEWFIDRTGID